MVTTATSAPPACLDALHHAFLAILPAIERHGRVYFRHLRCLHRLEEALAEMTALAWRWFLRLVQQGKDPADFPTVSSDNWFSLSATVRFPRGTTRCHVVSDN
jgi:hypothetical protein